MCVQSTRTTVSGVFCDVLCIWMYWVYVYSTGSTVVGILGNVLCTGMYWVCTQSTGSIVVGVLGDIVYARYLGLGVTGYFFLLCDV